MNMNGMDAGGARGQTPGGHVGEGDPGMRVFKPPDAAPGTPPSLSSEPGVGEVQFMENAISASLTDGTTPLKYSAFLAAASNNHQAAFQNALDALASSGTAAYRRYLDLEGARVVLSAPVTLPTAATDNITSVYNGEIAADPSFSGTHLITGINPGSLQYRFVNVTFNGSNVTSWLKWNQGNLLFFNCHFYYCDTDGTAGLFADNIATFYLRGCRFWAGDKDALPTSRTRVAVRAVGDSAGDQKISSCVFAHFKHAIIYDAFTLLMTDCHIFQGRPADTATDAYTAGIKLTRGTVGTMIVNLYLDKCFVEISNETNPDTDAIGGLHIIGMKTLSVVSDANFAFIRVRDYHSQTNLKVLNIILVGCQFSHTGNAVVTPTALHNSQNFDRASYEGVSMRACTFSSKVTPQSNPAYMRKTFGPVTTHNFDFTGNIPFAGRPREVISIVGNRSGGSAQHLERGAISGSTVDITSPAAWAGDITVGITCNNPEPNSGGFFSG